MSSSSGVEQVQTQPVPVHIAAALQALAGVLAGDPAELEVGLVIAEVMDILDDVRPLYPPLIYPGEPVPPAVGVPAALAALHLAAAAAGSVAEATRVGRAGHALRQLLPVS